MTVVGGAAFLLVFLLGRVTSAEPVRDPSPSSPTPICTLKTVGEFVFPLRDEYCGVESPDFLYSGDVIEGNEVALQKALNSIHKNEYDYVALLFYSSWCPFSGLLKLSFSWLSSIFTSIPHFVIEESTVRPSTLSKYGVHGFPTLILLNSTMRVRYQGSRTRDSLLAFYDEFTGVKTSADKVSFDKTGCSVYDGKHESFRETCPFPWAKSPENLLHQDTYLTLATIFVLLRLLHCAFPVLQRYTQSAWRRYTTYVTVRSLWERPAATLNQVIQLFNSLKEPCKKSNLQGAKNAKAWASKSLATVSFGDARSRDLGHHFRSSVVSSRDSPRGHDFVIRHIKHGGFKDRYIFNVIIDRELVCRQSEIH